MYNSIRIEAGLLVNEWLMLDSSFSLVGRIKGVLGVTRESKSLCLTLRDLELIFWLVSWFDLGK